MGNSIQDLFQDLSEVVAKPLNWVWEGVIPAGKLSVLIGESGAGKSYLAMHIAAKVSRGLPLPKLSPASATFPERSNATARNKTPEAASETPAGSPPEPASGSRSDSACGSLPEPSHVPPLDPGSTSAELDPVPEIPEIPGKPQRVVFFAAEDAPDDTLLPRLTAMGADVSNISVLRTREPRKSGEPASGDQAFGDPAAGESSHGLEHRSFRLTRDLSRLEESLDRLKERGTEVGLMVLDPIDRYFSPSDKRADRADAYSRLAGLAERTGVAILVIADPKLSRNGTVEYHLAMAHREELINTARSVFLVAKDLEHLCRRLLLPIKSNLCEEMTGLAFFVEQGDLDWDSESIPLTGEEYFLQAKEKLKNPLVREEVHEIHRATNWLREKLTPGRALSSWIRLGASGFDISYANLRQAFKILGCRITKESRGRYFWQLHGKEFQASEEEQNTPLETPEGGYGKFREGAPASKPYYPDDDIPLSRAQGAQTVHDDPDSWVEEDDSLAAEQGAQQGAQTVRRGFYGEILHDSEDVQDAQPYPINRPGPAFG